MAYYSGTANSITDLLNAVRNSAQSDGWTLSGNVLSRAGVHVEHTIASSINIAIRGGLDASMGTPSPYMHIGSWNSTTNGLQITFPCAWLYFGFTDETWFVVNYDVERYQMMAWGKSNVPGLPGTGAWIWASDRGSTPEARGSATTNLCGLRVMTSGSPLGVTAFWSNAVACAPWIECSTSLACSGYVHHDIGGFGWNMYVIDGAPNWSWLGDTNQGNLLSWQPSAWNSEIVLLPLRAFVRRGGIRTSLVLDHARARICRIDNLQSGDILTIGSTKWMVFPWHRRNASARNGATSGVAVDHTGTLGVAIEYEGP